MNFVALHRLEEGKRCRQQVQKEREGKGRCGSAWWYGREFC